MWDILLQVQGIEDPTASLQAWLFAVLAILPAGMLVTYAAGQMHAERQLRRADREADMADIYAAMLQTGVPYEVRLLAISRRFNVHRARVKDAVLGKAFATLSVR